MRGAQSEECSRRVEQQMVDAGEAFHTEAAKRPRSTDDPQPDDTVESGAKKARPVRNETAKDLVAKISAVGSLWCNTQDRFDERCNGWDRKIHCS